jgi:hypothetical protein
VRSHPPAATTPDTLRAALRRAAAETDDPVVSTWLKALATRGEGAAVGGATSRRPDTRPELKLTS